jgi:hypothetical protein
MYKSGNPNGFYCFIVFIVALKIFFRLFKTFLTISQERNIRFSQSNLFLNFLFNIFRLICKKLKGYFLGTVAYRGHFLVTDFNLLSRLIFFRNQKFTSKATKNKKPTEKISTSSKITNNRVFCKYLWTTRYNVIMQKN